jgi:hypothetical protein
LNKNFTLNEKAEILKFAGFAQEDNSTAWEQPLPFRNMDLPPFPVNELPPVVESYVRAAAETTQTSPDMAAVASLAVLALCLQGKFKIEGKKDWIEPLNLYTLVIAPPAERKSAVMALMGEPVKQFENAENDRLAPYIEQNKIEKQALLNRKKMMETKLAKSRFFNTSELQSLSQELSEFKDIKPCRLFCDDITPEKLSGILSDNDGKTAILSAEGGIFDVLAGRYSGSANIDVFLKAHSGDSIRVDRQGRQSEYIKNPSMTTLIFSQPSVMTSLIANATFHGRGLCARFLYSIPVSTIGNRNFESNAIDETTADNYFKLVNLLLEFEADGQKLITLSDKAYGALKEFAERIEPMLVDELADISDFAGKLVGSVLRIAGLLYIAEQTPLYHESELIADEYSMRSAIAIGEYFLEHAKAAYQLMGADEVAEQCKYILRQLQKFQPQTITVRDIMRTCKKFKTADAVKIPLDRLCEYEYLREYRIEYTGNGRPSAKQWEINPAIYNMEI